MSAIGKLVIIAGLVLVAVGLVIWGLGRLGFRGLPGDLSWESGDGTRIYIPVVTMIVASILLTILINLVLWRWRWMQK